MNKVIMCDAITMPNGQEIESIVPETCLCRHSQKEILKWIVEHVSDIEYDQELIIGRTPFGYEVKIL